MNVKHPELTGNRKFVVLLFALAITLIIDTALVKINDLVDKYIMPVQSKIILFFGNSSICLFLQLFIIRFIISAVGGDPFNKTPKVRTIYIISLTSFSVLTILVALLVFQLFYNHYYETWINISIITISYGTSTVLVIWLALLFFYWYKSSHDLVVFLYFISMSLIAFHLIITASFIDAKLSENQYLVGEYVGASGDAALNSHLLLGNIYRISSFISFFGIWMTTAILFNSYKEKLIRSVTYWILLILPLAYFLLAYFYQFFLSNVLTYYFENDPLTVSVLVSAFLTLSKPIGGIMFAFAFWNMSRRISYERKMKMSLVIAGWGIFFIFSANQASTQVIIPYPPFGITTVTVLNVAAFLLLVGISSSAINVSQDRELRREFYNSAISKMNLLKTIGVAQMEKELIKKYESMVKRTSSLEEHTPFEKDDVKEALHGLVDEMDINKAREILRDVLTEIYAKSRTKDIS